MSVFSRLSFIVFVAVVFVAVNPSLSFGKEDIAEEKEVPKKKYRNPFESLQKQRTKAEENKAKAIQQATPKAGTKTKRKPSSKLADMYSKKINTINGKILKKYISLVKGYKRIQTLKDKIEALNDRLKMTSSTESTMEQISKAEGELLELKEEFQAKVVDFEPVMQNFLKCDLAKKYPWVKDFSTEK